VNNSFVNTNVLTNLYHFIAHYYDDAKLADYILNAFSIDKENIQNLEMPYDKFYRILHYIQKMSGEQLFCFDAGRYFSETRLLKTLSIPGIRFSLKGTIGKIDKILKNIFPAFDLSVKSKSKNSLNLLLSSNGNAIKPNYFFIEYIKGIISQIPKKWDLPLAEVKVESYPFSLDEILKDVDIPYKKDNSHFFIYDQEIAKEEKNSDSDPTGPAQIIKNDLFIKDLFIQKGIKLNSGNLSLKLKWHNFSILHKLVYNLLSIAALPVFIYGLINYYDLKEIITGCFIIYELVIILIRNIHKNKKLIKIYKESESDLLDELSTQRSTTSEAIQDTAKRLQSIENVIEITKEIIYDKDIVNLFENIRKLSAKALNADRTTVFLHDKEKKELRSGPELSEEKQEFRIPEDKGIVGEVFKLKKIVNVKDAYNNPNFNKAIDRQTGYETKTILSAPLLDLEKNFMGVIQVLNKKDGEFEKIDEHIIETLSTYIASALKDTLTISSLQKRGIDPDMLNGLTSVTQHIHKEFNSIQDSLSKIENPEMTAVQSSMLNLSRLLAKLAFLFKEKYSRNETEIKSNELINAVELLVKNKIINPQITFEEKINIPDDSTMSLDTILFFMSVSEMFINSIEAIDKEGKIILRVYNYVTMPNELIHELSLEKIVSEYNIYSEENSAGFIKFVTARKPFLESDLENIKSNLKEFIAFECFDTGSKIPPGIKEKIFQPFFSTKNRFGLGLAIAKKAALLLEGMIEGPITEPGGKSIRILVPLKN
jgi:signal transduction histidine kinase